MEQIRHHLFGRSVRYARLRGKTPPRMNGAGRSRANKNPTIKKTGMMTRFISMNMSREPLNKFMATQQDLKRADARRTSLAMAVALGKKCNNVDARFRSCPEGLTGKFALCVAIFRQASACLQNRALIANLPVSLSGHKLIQRLPRLVCGSVCGNLVYE